MTERARVVMERADVLAGFTEERGRITRPYGTSSLLDARDAVREWMQEAGLTIRQDAVGNLIGRCEPRAGSNTTFVLGSHIDSVRDAGRYDGPLGVLVALAAVEELRARDQSLPFAIEVVAFIDEEGLRYHASYLGSRVFAGILPEAELAIRDADGVPLADSVRVMRGDPECLAEAARDADDLIGYCEVHIEQGPVLEAEGLPLGTVTSIAGQSRGTVTFRGRAGHAGTVPMDLRHDALCAAAELVLAVEALARDWPGLVATVGQIAVSPGAGNVIPGQATLSFDVRHQDDERRVAACRTLQERAADIARVRGMEADWQTIQQHPATPSASHLIDLLSEAAESVTGTARRMASGAGHDAVSMSHLTDVVMLFVRCRGGVSHHPDESVQQSDVAAAIDALAAFLTLLAREGAIVSAGSGRGGA